MIPPFAVRVSRRVSLPPPPFPSLPDNETRERPFITDRTVIGKSLYSPPPVPSRFSFSLETPTPRGGSNDNYLFESVNRRIIDRPPIGPRRSTRSLLSSPLSKLLRLIAPCNNYPRRRPCVRECTTRTRGLSHRGG